MINEELKTTTSQDEVNKGSRNFKNDRNDRSDARRDGSKPKRPTNNRRVREEKKDDFEERVVTINRVTKVTKGGRHFRFAAVVVVGDRKGHVGFGTGKANEVPDAIKKAAKEARKNLITVELRGTTIPHEVLGTFGAGKVLIKPAKEGTGVIAGGPSRAIVELAGITDIYTKSLGSNTPINMIRATMNGLASLQTLKRVKDLRFSKPEVIKPVKEMIKTDKPVAEA